MNEASKSRGLWNRSFALLWQGQLVSAAGDAVYQIALGFWVLAETGSTGLMGALIGVGLLPRLVLAPIAGAVADRVNRRAVLVIADLVAGLCILAVGGAAVLEVLEVWMLFAAGLVVGGCSAFFFPTVESVIPDLAPPDKLVRANAAVSLAHATAGIGGNAAGGLLFQLLGAPLLFLINGATFLLSALSELFIAVPRTPRRADRRRLRDDLRAGLSFAGRTPGVRYLLVVTALVNFFGTLALFLLLPLFEADRALGATWYGLLMGCFAAGGLVALLLTSFAARGVGARSGRFVVLGVLDAGCIAALPWMPGIFPMLALVTVSGFATALENTYLLSALQAATPPELRGKLFGLRETLISGLVPAAIAVGGLLAEVVAIPVLISGASAVVLMGFLLVPALPAARRALDF